MNATVVNYLISMEPILIIVIVLLAIVLAPLVTRTQGHIRRLTRNLSVFSMGVIAGMILNTLIS